MVGGLMLNMMGLFLVGVALFSMVLVFQIVTLPSSSTLLAGQAPGLEHGLVTSSERDGMASVLSARR